jgi:hypothetical protein
LYSCLTPPQCEKSAKWRRHGGWQLIVCMSSQVGREIAHWNGFSSATRSTQ